MKSALPKLLVWTRLGKSENTIVYTGHCFRRTSAIPFADTVADIQSLKSNKKWKFKRVINRAITWKWIECCKTNVWTFTKITTKEAKLKMISLRNINIENCTNWTVTFNIHGSNEV